MSQTSYKSVAHFRDVVLHQSSRDKHLQHNKMVGMSLIFRNVSSSSPDSQRGCPHALAETHSEQT